MKLWDWFKYDLVSPGNARGAVATLQDQACAACGGTLKTRFFSCDYEKWENSQRELRRDWWFQGYAVCEACKAHYITEAENDPTEFYRGYHWVRAKADWVLEKVYETYQARILEEMSNLTTFYQARQKLDPRQSKVTFKILKYNKL